ncbi:hypothetical protein C0W92_21285 [Photobacterium angustum]|uniref:beta-barrel assembly-enhancing protease n=1 Tax=Photobacterium angustum TaxID=661 RepID=UPI000D1542EE|nr:M48 family metalloprotease [Photobacterium angustum]PSV62812.1 hypothetical protein CTM95_19455 [Photobacterium angustum]PSV96148.1 hypothetical protein CTN01_00140 [Photobacterium angustum]PSW80742.1 hypothetical protein CTN03_11855 [Photobacterium angustum]PSW87574.1 hypothetical protein C0W92_21285 [Photobacterium angustum]PSW91355.1 hypothetical protein C0W79_20570 [Photobacterium angustum]
MFRFAKAPTYLLLSALLSSSIPAIASDDNRLPEMGTTASSTLTIDKEREYGDAYMRVIRASQPVISDPLLSDYVQSLGHKLVANAEGVRTPFYFFLIQNYEINAFAFFGGHVALHSGLFLHAQSESELASVLAHEIAHVTQRHLARKMEADAKNSPLTVAALVGSLLLTVAAPEAGIAAIHATTAANIQGQINFTRSNEKEADSIGIKTLAKAGFDAHAMPRFFERLAEQYRYTSKLPAMLLTHPLPESRVTDSRMRARNYPTVVLPPSERYLLARSRVVARNAGFSETSSLNWLNRELKKAAPNRRKELNYGKALVYIDNAKYKQAHQLLDPLIAGEPDNMFYIDAATDLDLNQKQYQRAISRLVNAQKNNPDSSVLRINLANAYIEAGKYQQSIQILNRYTYDHPDDTNGWALLAKSYAKLGNRAAELASFGELLALRAQWDKAINNYMQAAQMAKLGSMEQARYDARIDQLRFQRQEFKALQ